MSDITRSEFEDLKKQVRSLERKVEEQQKQIATLKRRTTTDASGSASSKSAPSSAGTSNEVPRSAVQRDIIDILRDESEDGQWVEVETIKNEAAQLSHLRSEAKAVIRKWIQQGYLAGEHDGRVRVVEMPDQMKPVDE
jgi:archaellum component FlaC